MPLIIVSIQSYLTLISRVQLVFLILKQHFLSVYWFTLKSMAFTDNTLLVTFVALIFHFVCPSACIHFFPRYNKACHDFSTKFIFHHAYKLSCFFLLVVACYHPFNIHLYQTLSLHLLQCFCKSVLSLSHTQSCLCPYNIALPYFHA